MKKIFICFLLFVFGQVNGQEEIRLYQAIPNSKPSENMEKSVKGADGKIRISQVSVPEMTMYTPPHPNGTAVIICPGGGYGILAASHEGSDVAKVFNEWDVTAFVLKYRLPDDKIMLDKSIAPLQDAERAIQLVRENAKKWNINPKKIGIMGFSAGGHLAASLSTRYNEVLIENPRRTSLRPDFSILIYPVISFTDSLTHMGSRNNLIGKNPSPATIRKYSNELQVNKRTPPAFLVHAKDDKGVPWQNSQAYYDALRKFKIPAQVKYYEKGGHGFGMNNPTSDEKWMEDLKAWMSGLK
jgi:acetyl esterase/lipase